MKEKNFQDLEINSADVVQIETKKIQVQRRMTTNIVPCDKLSNHPFNIPADKYAFILQNRAKCGCCETKNVVTPYWLDLCDGYIDLSPLNSFHREILFSAISAYEQGFKFLTISMMFDNLTGNAEKRHIYKEQYTAIREAIDKLGFTRITVDLEPLFKAMPKYKENYTGEARLVGTLLPCRYFDAEINGQKTFVMELLGESPLMTVARLKKQVLTYDTTPLAIANQKNTPLIITVKNYLLRRIELIKRGLNTSILLDTIYSECGITDKWKKQDVRKVIEDTLKSFKANDMIKDFKFKRQGRAYRSIAILT